MVVVILTLMKTMRFILSLWMVGSILFAGCLSRSADFHAWLHDGEDFCHVEDTHCPDKGHVGHHHEGESTEEHPHGLLTLMAGAGMDSVWIPPIVPADTESQWFYLVDHQDALPGSTYLNTPPGRAPPVFS